MTETIKVGFKRLNDNAIIPSKAHPTDSGFDLYASEDVIIEPGETVIVPTGIAVQLPEGYEAQVRPRSGITAKTKLRVQLGTIDNAYRGEIGVIVDNIAHWHIEQCTHTGGITNRFENRAETLDGNAVHTKKFDECVLQPAYIIREGDRIAQLVIQRLPETDAVEITEFSEDSERGVDGFGSSGV